MTWINSVVTSVVVAWSGIRQPALTRRCWTPGIDVVSLGLRCRLSCQWNGADCFPPITTFFTTVWSDGVRQPTNQFPIAEPDEVFESKLPTNCIINPLSWNQFDFQSEWRGGGGVRQHGHPPVAGTRDVTIQRLFLRFFSEILGIWVMADADNLLEQKKKKRKEHKRMKRNGQ